MLIFGQSDRSATQPKETLCPWENIGKKHGDSEGGNH
jgi:hypothetical protein